jgi:DNA polymerase I-like protein with 3'-5' exonuclease and polymerase domains
LGNEKLAAAKREAMNAPIQGTVADALNVGLINLDRMRYETEIGRTIKWEVMVGIHDALLVHYPIKYTKVMAGILAYCMSDTVPLPGTNGRTLGVDVEMGERWGKFETVKDYPRLAA